MARVPDGHLILLTDRQVAIILHTFEELGWNYGWDEDQGAVFDYLRRVTEDGINLGRSSS